jgi:hypothetical protein
MLETEILPALEDINFRIQEGSYPYTLIGDDL